MVPLWVELEDHCVLLHLPKVPLRLPEDCIMILAYGPEGVDQNNPAEDIDDHIIVWRCV
jgi:hypothetical protein